MSDSPYQSPQSPNSETEDSKRELLRRVAKNQRMVIFALLANIGANVVSFMTLGQDAPIRLAVMGVSLLVVIFAMYAIFSLANELSGAGIGILCAILMLIPCVSLICLLVVNQKATALLQSNGVRVGFLGTDPSTI